LLIQESLGFFREERPEELEFGNALEEYISNIYEYEKLRSGIDYISQTLDSDASSGKRSSFKKTQKSSTFEIFVIQEVLNEEEASSSYNDKSIDNSRYASSDKSKPTSFEIRRLLSPRKAIQRRSEPEQLQEQFGRLKPQRLQRKNGEVL
jgi:hypothetical protein